MLDTAHKTGPTLELLREQRAEILALAERFKAHSVRIFGSVSRSTARADSDIDFLVVFDPDYTLLDHAGLIVSLRDLLGWNVDVVNEPFLREEFRLDAIKDAVWL